MSVSSPGTGAIGVVRRLSPAFGVQGAGFAATTALQILLVPVFLAAWGAERYADWLVLHAAAALLSLADLGLHGQAVVLRLTGARGDSAGVLRVLSSGLGAYLMVLSGVVALLALGLATLDVTSLLGVPAADRGALVLLCLSWLLLLPRGLVTSLYFVYGEFGCETTMHQILTLGQMVAPGAAALAGAGLGGAAAAHLAASLLLGWGPVVADLRRRHAGVALRPALPRRAEWVEMARRAPLYALPLGATMLLQQVPVLMLSRFAGAPEAVVAFTTMRTFTGLTRQPVAQFSSLAGIEMARQHVQGDRAGLRTLHAGVVRATSALVGMVAGLSLVFGPAFFAIWTHGAVRFDPWLAVAFLAVLIVAAPGYADLSLLRHGDRPRPVAVVFSVQTLLAVVLCALLIPLDGRWCGAVGAAVAIGLTEVAAFGITLGVVFGRMLGEPPLPHVARALARALLGLAAGGGAALAVERLIAVNGMAGALAFVALWAALAAPAVPFLLFDAGQRAWLYGRLTARCAR